MTKAGPLWDPGSKGSTEQGKGVFSRGLGVHTLLRVTMGAESALSRGWPCHPSRD